jgi:hypothetical protein
MLGPPRSSLRRKSLFTILRTCWSPVRLTGSAFDITYPKTEYADAAEAMAAHRIDLERVRRFYPPALRYPPARILHTIAALKELNVDYAKALNRWPHLCSSLPEHWEDRLTILRGMNLDVAKMVTSYPAIVSHLPDTLRAKVEALSRMGLDAAKVVRLCPTVFCYTENRLRGTLSFLDGVGLNGVQIVNAVPVVLSCSVDTKLRTIVQFVTVEMARDIKELQRSPEVFTRSLERRLRPRYAFATLHSKQCSSMGVLFVYTDRRFSLHVGQPLHVYQAWLSQHFQK